MCKGRFHCESFSMHSESQLLTFTFYTACENVFEKCELRHLRYLFLQSNKPATQLKCQIE